MCVRLISRASQLLLLSSQYSCDSGGAAARSLVAEYVDGLIDGLWRRYPVIWMSSERFGRA